MNGESTVSMTSEPVTSGDLEQELRYPLLFRVGWTLFFAGSLYLGWNSLGILLLIAHSVLDRSALSKVVGTGLATADVSIDLHRVRLPLNFLIFVLGATGLVSAVLAVHPGRATAALIGMMLSIAFGLLFGIAYQVHQPGWFLRHFFPGVLAGGTHVTWALWKGVHIGSLDGERVGTISGPNYTGTMMLLVLIIGLSWFASQRTFWKWLSIPYALAAAIAMIFTYSRGSWVAAFVFCFMVLVPLWQRPSSRRYGWLVAVGTVLFVCLVVAMTPGVMDRAKTFLTLYDDGRVTIWKRSWEMFLDHFWLGVGPANFAHHWGKYDEEMRFGAMVFPHNMWLQVLTETGILGGVLFALLVGRVLLAVWRLRSTSDWSVWILACGVIALLVRDLTDAAIFNINTSFLFWWMAGTILAAEQVHRGRNATT